ncbi:homeobox protein knotted-1-like 13 isoform X2 [Cryptomeria japonica]|uniref:homeobox protein knotted-1-like 13 isoform X2 n=1 Tax=Cryptomeria japonica TaxID=3369 RepID=UPI0025AD601B|nr:homeobox protein knotted-1-like 13 isoform X2 [Cryptomeria japonica]
MAFHSLSHKMSVPQHSSEPPPQHLERGSHEQFLFRQREKEDDKGDVCVPNLRSLVQSGKELAGGGGGGGGGGGDGKAGAPTWLSSAILRQQNQQYAEGGGREESRKWCGCCEPGSRGCVQCSFLNLTGAPSNSATVPAQWLPRAFRRGSEVLGEEVTPGESMMALSHGSGDVKNHSARGLVDLHSSDTANSGDLQVDSGGGGGGGEREADDGNDNHAAGLWQNAKFKADILSHPLYEQLLSAHVACLRIATPVDQLPRIDAQLAQSQHVVSKYSLLASNNNLLADEKELDQFMTHYVFLLCSFKEQLQQHVRVHAMEAVMACWELEQSLLSLTGVSPGEGTGATMSDDDDDQGDSDTNLYDGGLDGHDTGGFGPLIPTETERSLMERVRQELKHDLKQGYKARIVDVREEILRKRRAGKLPGDTTSLLKAWWQSHSKWPYPTEDEKARLVQETGLQLKQINNWFINQRKRNWHSNPSSSNVLKSKRKR